MRQHQTCFRTDADDDHVPARQPDPDDGIVHRAWGTPDDIEALTEPVRPPDLTARLPDAVGRA